jgi:hypothetical protein
MYRSSGTKESRTSLISDTDGLDRIYVPILNELKGLLIRSHWQ